MPISLPKHRTAGRVGLAIVTHLHNDVEGKVKKQIADADGQQVGGKIIGAHNEPIGSPGKREGGLVKQGRATARKGLALVPTLFLL